MDLNKLKNKVKEHKTGILFCGISIIGVTVSAIIWKKYNTDTIQRFTMAHDRAGQCFVAGARVERMANTEAMIAVVGKEKTEAIMAESIESMKRMPAYFNKLNIKTVDDLNRYYETWIKQFK